MRYDRVWVRSRNWKALIAAAGHTLSAASSALAARLRASSKRLSSEANDVHQRRKLPPT